MSFATTERYAHLAPDAVTEATSRGVSKRPTGPGVGTTGVGEVPPRPNVSPGWYAFGEVLWNASERAVKVAEDMGSLEAELARPPGGQRDEAARTAARKLLDRGLTLPQATEVLARTGVVPDSYTSDNLRDLLRKGRRADDTETPGKDPAK